MRQSFVYRFAQAVILLVFVLVLLGVAVQVFLMAKYGLPALEAGVQIIENVAEQTKPVTPVTPVQ